MSSVSEQGGGATLEPVPAVLFRGGTSKCWVFRTEDLPRSSADRDAMLLRLFGSPDRRQIDGVGGGSSTTSKALVVETMTPSSPWVGYQVGQVSVDENRVEWESNCGNCASALALYAVQLALVSATSSVTEVPLLNVRTGLRLRATVDTPGAKVPFDGDELIPGTVHPGVPVDLHWSSETWSTFGTSLPTGRPSDMLSVAGKDVRATMVDAGAPAALVSAEDLGISRLGSSIDDVERHLAFLAELRDVARARMSLTGTAAGDQSVPKVGIIGRVGDDSAFDVEARMVSMNAPHPALGVTSAVAIAVASTMVGSVVHDALRTHRTSAANAKDRDLVVGTPVGPVRIPLHLSATGELIAVTCRRSARRILDARLNVPNDWRPPGHASHPKPGPGQRLGSPVAHPAPVPTEAGSA